MSYDLSKELRNYANNNGYSHNDYADIMREAADRITELEARTPAAPQSIDGPEFRALADAYHCVNQQEDVEPTYQALYEFVDDYIVRLMDGTPAAPVEPPKYDYGPDGKGPVTLLNPMSPRDWASVSPAAPVVAEGLEHNKHFTPMENRGTLVYLGRSGGFDVRDCPEPESLAAFIVAACNSFAAHPVAGSPAEATVKGKTAAEWYVAYCEASASLKAADGCIERYKKIAAAEPMPASEAAYHTTIGEDGEYELRTADGKQVGTINFYADAQRIVSATAAPVPASEAASVPDELRVIAEQMRSQDNECTANPLFHVEQRRTITGIDTDYDPEIVWCIEDSMIFKGDEEFAALESAYEERGTVPENYTRTGYVHEWEFVTAFFTRSAAEQFVAQHAHKYSGPLRMSVETEPRNREMKLVRDFLQSLAAPAAPTDAKAQTNVEKMLETNQLDELGQEVARLQKALCFWLPSQTDREDEVALRILEDAFLLYGIDGNLPDDFKSAQELGWVTLAANPTAQIVRDAAQPNHETIVREGSELVCTACGTSAPAQPTIAQGKYKP